MRDPDYSDVVRDARRMIEQGEAPAGWPAAPVSTERVTLVGFCAAGHSRPSRVTSREHLAAGCQCECHEAERETTDERGWFGEPIPEPAAGITPHAFARSLLEGMDHATWTGPLRDGGRYASFSVQLDSGQAFRITVEEIDS